MLGSLVIAAPTRPDRVVMAEMSVPAVALPAIVRGETLARGGFVLVFVGLAALAHYHVLRLRKKKIPTTAAGTSKSEMN